ncbi:MAG: 1-acyl-sn-glycerol-3-phosphate acyltransferase [Rhodobacteraceae bacterium]|nr:1-acyl-sn-glycerol-3-phosphate acyltransferase [Paracoccaceae bacterium]
MSVTWNDGPYPTQVPVGAMGWLRALRRGVPLVLLVLSGLVILLLVRLVEKPLYGLRRPLTPWITQSVCRAAFAIIGIPLIMRGKVMPYAGAMVSNHVSWLDILALNARKRIYFVSKAEVAGWPGIGWLAKATGTVFIKRERREASGQVTMLRDRLVAGQRLLFFPEGTSSDGMRILPFKPTLFASLYEAQEQAALWVQPVTLNYFAPDGVDARFYGWWGDMELGPHLLLTLAARKQGRVEVVYHPPLAIADYDGRKALAAACEATIRSGLAETTPIPPQHQP